MSFWSWYAEKLEASAPVEPTKPEPPTQQVRELIFDDEDPNELPVSTVRA